MSYNTGDPQSPPPLAMPLAQLPPFPETTKRRRYWTKTTEAPPDEVDQQATSGDELQPQTQPGDRIDEEMQPGYEPQQISPDAAGMSAFLQEMSEEARAAFDEMVKLFLTRRNCVSVNVCHSMLHENTCAYLHSLEQQRPL